MPPNASPVDDAAGYASVMAVLLLLFLARVLGQIFAATLAPSWLPPMGRWYSGLMPYRYLLPTQIVFLVIMTAMTLSVAHESAPLGMEAPAVATWVIRSSYVYALAMVARSVRYARTPPEGRGVLIPIVFHFVLAAFLFVWGSALLS